jgi:hypothetical protein
MAKTKGRKKKAAKPRARARPRGRQAKREQPVAVIGQSISAVTPTQMEALDKLRMTPDIVKDLEKKKQDDRFKDLTDSNTKLAQRVDHLQQHSRQQAQTDASTHTGTATE